jgi:phosphoribosyl 1,2-cyclic phosphodiesterase
MGQKTIAEQAILLPPYALNTLKTLPWIESSPEGIQFHDDDFIAVLYGVRGSTAFSGPATVRYGSNTTAYQIWSPKLPTNVLYLGDGGSGILEIDDAVIRKMIAAGVNPFTASASAVSPHLARIINTYTHYHYDHLHLGAPLAGLFHANSVPKTIIGGENPKSQFVKTFKRPAFPRDFGEMQASYSFHDISDPRSSVLIFTPNGEFRDMSTSDFNTYLDSEHPQVRHNKVFYDLRDCVVVRLYNADHPDPCISYRYENYDHNGRLANAFVMMTDHEIRETDDRNAYFTRHVKDADVVYFDAQYNEKNFVPGFGHGRVEIVGAMAATLGLENVLLGHHDPKRTDDQIDAMVEEAHQAYQGRLDGKGGRCKIVGASDRMMIFIPAASRGRRGVVFGRMNIDRGDSTLTDDIGDQATVVSRYQSFDLTQIYRLEDHTTERA